MPISYLVADVDEIAARLELYRVEDEIQSEVSIASKVYSTQNFSSFTDLVQSFLEEEVSGEDFPTVACCSMTGPVADGFCIIPNLCWKMSEEEMALDLGIDRVVFINDFIASGYGLLIVPDEDLILLNKDATVCLDSIDPKCIIGAGNGLSEAVLTHDGTEFNIYPGEGGFSDFAPRTSEEFGLLTHIKSRLRIDSVSVQRIVSNHGIESIYWYLVYSSPELANDQVSEEIRQLDGDGGLLICKYAKFEPVDFICHKAILLFLSAFGAEVGNVACRSLPKGGIFITGEITPKILEILLESDTFMANYCLKGRMRPYLEEIPIFVVTTPSIGILGARVRARRCLRDQGIFSHSPGSDGEDTKETSPEQEAFPLRSQPSKPPPARVKFERNELRDRSPSSVWISSAWKYLAVGVCITAGLTASAFCAGRRSSPR
uniref:Glucokinase n=1 Tax=Hirondellea gigas TaxID=1518452 RepID=A0A6A7FW30_9CRUS